MAIGTPVQLGNNANGGGVLTCVITTVATAAAGDLIVVFASVGGTATNITGVTDSAGNTYTAGTQLTASSACRIRPFYCTNSAGLASGGTITVTFSTINNTEFCTAVSVSGIATASARDIEGAGTTGTGTTPSIATGTLAQADEIVFGFIMVNTGKSDAFTQATGFTANGANTSQVAILRSAYQIVASTSTVTYAPVLGTSRIYMGNVITFKAAAAAGAAYFREPAHAMTPFLVR